MASAPHGTGGAVAASYSCHPNLTYRHSKHFLNIYKKVLSERLKMHHDIDGCHTRIMFLLGKMKEMGGLGAGMVSGKEI